MQTKSISAKPERVTSGLLVIFAAAYLKGSVANGCFTSSIAEETAAVPLGLVLRPTDRARAPVSVT